MVFYSSTALEVELKLAAKLVVILSLFLIGFAVANSRNEFGQQNQFDRALKKRPSALSIFNVLSKLMWCPPRGPLPKRGARERARAQAAAPIGPRSRIRNPPYPQDDDVSDPVRRKKVKKVRQSAPITKKLRTNPLLLATHRPGHSVRHTQLWFCNTSETPS